MSKSTRGGPPGSGKSSSSRNSRSKSLANVNQRQDLITNAYNNQIIVKNADGEYAPVGYTKREVHAAEKAELISVARAMNDDFEPKVRKLFQAEVEAAERAIASGLYASFRCPEFTWVNRYKTLSLIT